MVRKLLPLALIVVTQIFVDVLGHGHLESVQIIETKNGNNDTKVLHYKAGPILKDILTADDVKDLPILVYSVTGKTRGGKSFLLDLMYKYLHSEGRSNWTDGSIPNVFDFKDGADSMTKGLWLCTRIFKRTLRDGTKIGIMLMDNQGLFDGEVTGGESVAMSGVSTILSHVQMFNMKEKITTNDLEQIMLHLVPEDVEDKSNHHSSIGSSLMFVVRDFMGGKKYGLGLTNGKKYIEEEQKRGTEEHQSMWAEQRSVFNKIECVLLPHPGLAVMTEEFTQSPNLQVLESSFVSEVGKFMRELFAPENLVPHTGGFTGQNMHDTLTKLDGKVADQSLSYYNMYIERTNHIILQASVERFSNKIIASGDVYRMKEYMEETLTGTTFKGQSAGEFTGKLRQTLTGIVNSKIKTHLLNLYKASTNGNHIVVRHGVIWSRIVSDLKLLVGSELEVKQNKEAIIQEMATTYYKMLASEESDNFKRYCETVGSVQFYDKMISLNQPDSLNVFLESIIKPCVDFERTGVNVTMLNDIRRKQQLQFGSSVKMSILRNMYKVKEFFVQRYKNTIKAQNVTAENALLWPKYKQDIDRLQFETEGERDEHTKAITKEIASIYYRLFREEVYEQVKKHWKSLSDGAFKHQYNIYKDESRLKGMIVERFPEYNLFSSQEPKKLWESEVGVLKTYLQLEIYNNLKSRRYEEESLSFWQKHGSTIVTAGLAVLAGWLG